jgi:hypothetical protein
MNEYGWRLDGGRREGSVPELVVTHPDSVSKPQNATNWNADSKQFQTDFHRGKSAGTFDCTCRDC